MNRVDDAPGADDDASGVAVSMELARVMATHEPDATIVFMAVAGEEQNLYGSNHAATLFKAAGTDIQGMLNNDIVGSSTADDGTRDRRSVRLFAEGISRPPTADRHAADPGRRRERHRPARARPLPDRGRDPRRDRHGRAADLPARPLPPRRRPAVLPPAGLPGRPVHRAARELRPRAPGRARRERRPVRRPAAVRRLRLRRRRGARERRGAVVAGQRARHAPRRRRSTPPSSPTTRRSRGPSTRPRPATRSSGGRPSTRSGPTSSRSARSGPPPSPASPRTTCCSASGPSAPTAAQPGHPPAPRLTVVQPSGSGCRSGGCRAVIAVTDSATRGRDLR